LCHIILLNLDVINGWNLFTLENKMKKRHYIIRGFGHYH